MLNRLERVLLLYVFSKISGWQSLSELQVTTLDDVTNLSLRVHSSNGFIPISKSGPKLPQVISAVF